MKYKKILITGGAGFVGSNLAMNLKKRYSESEIYCLDNLKRRGSELNISRFKEANINFVHGDIRNKEDLDFKELDLVIECSAEPSVLAGLDGSVEYVMNTNLVGTLNCLELARKLNARFIFLSTSRVYPYKPLNEANIVESDSRFDFSDDQEILGLSSKGVSEDFPVMGVRSIYGATKFASELFITEYMESFGMEAVVNRFGCIAGPWQMGKVDQGVMTLWVARHVFKKDLKYIGFGGKGKQVRDFLHIDDLIDVIDLQMQNFSKVNGQTLNIGGGLENSVSLNELTKMCEKYTGNKIKIDSDPVTRNADLKVYITNNSKITNLLKWKPKKTIDDIVKDTADWVESNKSTLQKILE